MYTAPAVFGVYTRGVLIVGSRCADHKVREKVPVNILHEGLKAKMRTVATAVLPWKGEFLIGERSDAWIGEVVQKDEDLALAIICVRIPEGDTIPTAAVLE